MRKIFFIFLPFRLMILLTGLPAPLRESVMCPRGDIFFYEPTKTTYSQQRDLDHIGFPADWSAAFADLFSL
jgi:hypothetical protein